MTCGRLCSVIGQPLSAWSQIHVTWVPGGPSRAQRRQSVRLGARRHERPVDRSDAPCHFVVSSSRLRWWVLLFSALRWHLSQTLTFGSSTTASCRCSTSFGVVGCTASTVDASSPRSVPRRRMQLVDLRPLSETLFGVFFGSVSSSSESLRTHSLDHVWRPSWGTLSGNTCLLSQLRADWVLQLQLFFDCFQRTLKQLAFAPFFLDGTLEASRADFEFCSSIGKSAS